MGAWYWIGVAAGLGAGAGVLFAGVFRPAYMATFLAILTGAAIGEGLRMWQPGGWAELVAGAVGGLLASVGAVVIVRGALRRGGTPVGTGVIVAAAALLVAGLAWVPALGYLEALALPVLAARLRRRQPERYAGLRTLAED